jgi:predicted transcriptional regulator
MARTKQLPKIGDLEMAVLQHLWRSGEADVQETHAAIGRTRGITTNTVGSALERLHRKGLVSREKLSHAYRYMAELTEDEFAARRIMDVAGGTQALAEAGLLAAFVDLVADEDEESLDRLEALIAQKRGQR